MLYDQLVKDLRNAGAAMRADNPEVCASEIKHALLIIQQLEGSLDRTTGEEFVTWLVRFYALIRSRIVEIQVKRSHEELDEQIAMILDVRGAWQAVESKNTSGDPSSTEAASVSMSAAQGARAEEYVGSNWSA
jgi:flagellar protein FliS